MKNRFSEGSVFRESAKVDTNFTLNQESYDVSDRNSNMLKAGFDYYVNKKNTINSTRLSCQLNSIQIGPIFLDSNSIQTQITRNTTQIMNR